MVPDDISSHVVECWPTLVDSGLYNILSVIMVPDGQPDHRIPVAFPWTEVALIAY